MVRDLPLASTGSTKRFWIAMAIVVLVAIVVRIAFAMAVIHKNDPTVFRNIHGDTNGYARIGENLFNGRKYATTAAGPGEGGATFRINVAKNRSRALARPPGYPGYYAAVRMLGFDLLDDMRPVVWPQVFASALVAGGVFWIGYLTLGHVTGSVIAGVFAIISPTAIAAASLATPDTLYSASFAGAFACYVTLACRSKRGRQRALLATISGVLLAAAVLLKPAAMYWPVLAAPALLVLRGVNFGVVRDLTLCFLPMLLVVGGWTAVNYQREGIATYSTIATRNLRYDVVPRIELAVELGRLPTRQEYKVRSAKVIKRDSATNGSGDGADLASVVARDSQEIRDAFRLHPVIAVEVMLANLWEQLSTGWLWIDKQLPGDDRASVAVRGVFHHTCDGVPLALWFASVTAALPLCVLRRDAAARGPILLCSLALAYVALGNCTVQGEGSRLMLAGESMSIVLITATLCYVGDILRQIVRRIGGNRQLAQPRV